MLKCRKCGCSDFGVEARQIMAMPYRLSNGEQIALAEQPEVKNELEYKFCFGCNAAITEADLYEKETCTVCGNEVDEVVNGKCHDCNAKAKALAKMTKDELITMVIQGKISPEDLASMVAPTQETKKEVKQETKVETKVEVPVQETKVEQVAPVVETKVEVPVVEEKVQEQVVQVSQTEELQKAMPNLEANQEVNLEEEIVPEDANDYLFEAPDVLDTDINLSQSAGEELDILTAIDKAVDLSALNLQCEDINQQL